MAGYKLCMIVLISCVMLPRYSTKTSHHESPKELLMMLNQTFSALDRLLSFFHQDIDKANLDAIYGIRTNQGILQRLLAAREPRGHMTSSRLTNIHQQLVKFHAQVNSLANHAQVFIEKQNTFYYNRFKFVVDKPWGYGVKFGKRSLPQVDQNISATNGSKISHSWDEGISDQCMSEVIGSNKQHKKCMLSKTCSTAMSDPFSVGYGPTHQILFLTLAHIRKCEKKYSDVFKRMVDMDVDDLIENRCTKILQEMLEIERNGIKKDDHDLYFEQAFVCGMHGYEEFFSLQRLQNILSWQLYPGCFGNVTEDDEALGMRRRRRSAGMSSMRRLLVDAKLDFGCSSHESGVATGLLGMYVKWLVYKLDTLMQPTAITTESMNTRKRETSGWKQRGNKEENEMNHMQPATPAKSEMIDTRKEETSGWKQKNMKENKGKNKWMNKENENGEKNGSRDYPLFLTVLVSFLTTILTLITFCIIYKLIFHYDKNRNGNSYKKLLHSDDGSYMA